MPALAAVAQRRAEFRIAGIARQELHAQILHAAPVVRARFARGTIVTETIAA
jgi:hypothetical protein